jgi:hypothetical protein
VDGSFLHGLLNEVPIRLVILQKNLQGFAPRFVDFFPANIFVSISEVQAHEANELFRITVFYGLAQIRN